MKKWIFGYTAVFLTLLVGWMITSVKYYHMHHAKTQQAPQDSVATPQSEAGFFTSTGH